MPVTLDASPFTSVRPSPIEAHGAQEDPIELKIPLPASSACSDEEDNRKEVVQTGSQDITNKREAGEEDIHSEGDGSKLEGFHEDFNGKTTLDEAPKASDVSLKELAHLVDLEAYQRQQTTSAKARRDQLRLSCGLDRRLISTFTIAYGNMIDQYKTDDQAGFAGLYEACEQLRTTCENNGHYNEHSTPEVENDTVAKENMESQSCLEMLPLEDQDTILIFLTQMRTEPNFLADRISNLSPEELTVLTSSYHPPGIDYSVLRNHSHGKTQMYSRDSQMMKLSRRMDNLHRFHNEDPFFVLLYGVFDSSAKPGSLESHRRTDIWSTVCAQNFVKAFTETRPGSDELAIATLDAFANFHDWPLKSKVETFLMRILSEGSFLLDAPMKQPVDFTEPVEMPNAKAAIAEASFFENALTGLLELLTQAKSLQAIPEGALNFSHAILRKIEDTKLRLRAKRYIVCSWYFAIFISSILVYPEVRGIMMTHHIGDSARKLILQQLVIHLQQRVFDSVLQWNGHPLVKSEIQDGVMAIFEAFEPPTLNMNDTPPAAKEQDEEASIKFLMLSPFDMIGLIQALYPIRTGFTNSSEPESAAAASDRPSTAGSSTLIAGSSEGESVLAPSTAPSTTGASVISIKDVNDTVTTGHSAKEQISHQMSEAEPKKGIVKTNERPPRDLSIQLRVICRRMKERLILDQPSTSIFSPDAWAMIYYTQDGSTLSVGPETRTEIFNSLTSREDDRNGDYEALKIATVKLLSVDGIPGWESLPVRAESKADGAERAQDPLESLMEAAMNRARSKMEFGTAYAWWSTLGIYRNYLASSPSASLHSILGDISEHLRRGIDAAINDAKFYEFQCRSLDRLKHHHRNTLADMEQQRKGLRVKMWYVSDVRHSATYEEALHVTHALRTMASSRRAKQPGSISSWARQRLRGSTLHGRAETQTLEAVAAPKDYGGLSKLADEQVELTSRWLTRKSVENFCKGEERIHRFCYEVQRSVNKIAGASLVDNPVLWSSNLFKRERFSFDTQGPRPSTPGPLYGASIISPSPFSYAPSPALASVDEPPRGLGFISAKTKSPTNSFSGFWNANQGSRPLTGNAIHQALPPTPTSPPQTWPGNPVTPFHYFGQPLLFQSSTGRHSSHPSNEGEPSPAKKAFAELIRRSLCCLLISDLGFLLWNQGSETDAWVNEHAAKASSNGRKDTSNELESVSKLSLTSVNDPSSFNFKEASRRTMTSYESDTSQYTVPRADEALHKTEAPHSTRTPPRGGGKDVSLGSIASRPSAQEFTPFPFVEAYASLLQSISLTCDPWVKMSLLFELEGLVLNSMQNVSSTSNRLTPQYANLGYRSKSVPRTKATSLEEVIANCTERRAGTLRTGGSSVGTGDVVKTVLSLFKDPKLRPKTLFRDLQYIAAFIPSETLDQTPHGKAFWDAGLAALALKEDLCESMVSRANDITAYHISAHKLADPSADNVLALTTLCDAAKLWLITAKEGSPVAARELGLFYLTHPELLPRVTMPFSKAKDVFKSVMSSDAMPGDKEKGALDPLTFAVVFHWMEIAANGGDKDASDFLRGNGELSAGR